MFCVSLVPGVLRRLFSAEMRFRERRSELGLGMEVKVKVLKLQGKTNVMYRVVLGILCSVYGMVITYEPCSSKSSPENGVG